MTPAKAAEFATELYVIPLAALWLLLALDAADVESEDRERARIALLVLDPDNPLHDLPRTMLQARPNATTSIRLAILDLVDTLIYHPDRRVRERAAGALAGICREAERLNDLKEAA